MWPEVSPPTLCGAKEWGTLGFRGNAESVGHPPRPKPGKQTRRSKGMAIEREKLNNPRGKFGRLTVALISLIAGPMVETGIWNSSFISRFPFTPGTLIAEHWFPGVGLHDAEGIKLFLLAVTVDSLVWAFVIFVVLTSVIRARATHYSKRHGP